MALTGCNGLAKARLDCLPQEAPEGVNTKQHKMQGQQDVLTIHPLVNNDSHAIAFCKKAYLAKLDSYNANCLEKILKCVLDLDLDLKFDISNYMLNCSSDAIHQIMGGCIGYMAHPVFKAFLKQNAAKLRAFVYKSFSDPNFINSISAPFKTTSNRSDSAGDINTNFNLIDLLNFCKKACLATLDAYNASLFEYVLMHALGFGFHILNSMSNSPSDFIDQIIDQIMESYILYMTHIIFKAFLKQKAAELRKCMSTCFSDPNCMNSVTTYLNTIRDPLYSGTANGARFCASIASSAGKRIARMATYGLIGSTSSVIDLTKWTLGTMYNGLQYNPFVMDNIHHIINCMVLQHACDVMEF